jgi:urease accessory protein
MLKFAATQWLREKGSIPRMGTIAAVSMALLLSATPAFAHHPLGGRAPASFFEGFLSGLAHPVIGPDHFAFIVAVGLFAAIKRQGIAIPIAFLATAMVGTSIHLASVSIPGVELIISGSILLFGILLSRQESPNTYIVAALAGLFGLFHGYAYGEAISGAGMTPIVAYLAGFTIIQTVISLAAYGIAKRLFIKSPESAEANTSFHSAGLVIAGIGIAFFVSQAIGLIFPAAA